VLAPTNWVLLSPEAEPNADRVWGLRGYLLEPRLAVTSRELERWLAGPEVSGSETTFGEAGETQESPQSGPPVAALVCWREANEPLVLTHVSQQVWLLFCSLLVLLTGLGLVWLTWPTAARPLGPPWAWPVLGLLLLAAIGAALLWPTFLGELAYGGQPGVAVLLLVAGAQWLLHERRRRRVVFLSSFSRARPNSAMNRGDSANRPLPPTGLSGQGEPSTVDVAPSPNGSGVDRRVNS
jgi:hypothetical protein